MRDSRVMFWCKILFYVILAVFSFLNFPVTGSFAFSLSMFALFVWQAFNIWHDDSVALLFFMNTILIVLNSMFLVASSHISRILLPDNLSDFTWASMAVWILYAAVNFLYMKISDCLDVFFKPRR